MPSYMDIGWVTKDNNACLICQFLEEHVWRVDSATGIPATLDAPGLGSVWNTVADRSTVHPNCRCHLEFFEPDCTDINNMIQSLIFIYERGINQMIFQEALPGVEP